MSEVKKKCDRTRACVWHAQTQHALLHRFPCSLRDAVMQAGKSGSRYYHSDGNDRIRDKSATHSFRAMSLLRVTFAFCAFGGLLQLELKEP